MENNKELKERIEILEYNQKMFENIVLKPFIILILLAMIIIFSLNLFSAQTITLTNSSIEGSLCNDQLSEIIFTPLDSNNELTPIDNFKYFIRPNESLFENVTNVFHDTAKPYTLIIDIRNKTVEELTFFGQFEQRGKIIKNNITLKPEKCKQGLEKVQKEVFDFERYVENNWVWIALIFLLISSLVALGVFLEQIRKK